jgi:hypothetical protein
VRALTAPKKSAARGLSVGRQAAVIPTFNSILGAVVSCEERVTGSGDAVLLPDVVPSASAGPVGRRLFRRHCFVSIMGLSSV